MKNGTKILKVGSLEVTIPRTLKVEAFKQNRIPGFRHFLRQESGETRLETVPLVGQGTIRFTDTLTGKNVIERKIGLTLANDGRTHVPMTMVEKVPVKWFAPASYVSVDQVNEIARNLSGSNPI